MVEINLCSIVFRPRILDLSQAVTLTEIQSKVKYLIWNYIRLWFVKKISISSPVKSLGYIKCYSLSSLSPIKPINVFLEFYAYWRKVSLKCPTIFFLWLTSLPECMLLSCHICISEWTHTLYLPECQGTPCMIITYMIIHDNNMIITYSLYMIITYS